jgi:hypothetical protein
MALPDTTDSEEDFPELAVLSRDCFKGEGAYGCSRF